MQSQDALDRVSVICFMHETCHLSWVYQFDHWEIHKEMKIILTDRNSKPSVFNPTTSSYPGSRQHVGEFDKVFVNFALPLSRAMFADGLRVIKITKLTAGAKKFRERFPWNRSLRLTTTRIFFFYFLRDQNNQRFNEDLLVVNASAFSFVLSFKAIDYASASNYVISANWTALENFL